MKEIKFIAYWKKHKIMCEVAVLNLNCKNVVLLANDEAQVKLFTELNNIIHIECNNRISVSMDDTILFQLTNNEIEMVSFESTSVSKVYVEQALELVAKEGKSKT